MKLTHYGFCFRQQEFFQYYTESGGSRPSADEENKMDLLRKGTNSGHRPAQIFRVQFSKKKGIIMENGPVDTSFSFVVV